MDRYILMLQPNFVGVLHLNIGLNSVNELEFTYKLYQITEQLPNSIMQGLQDNPMSTNVFNSIAAKTLLLKHSLSLGQASSIYSKFIELTELHKTNTDSYLCINFLPLLNTYLKYDQVLLLTSFLGQFINSYDVIKLNLFNQTVSNDDNNQPLQTVKTNSAVQNVDILKLIDIDNKPDNEILVNPNDIEVTIGRKFLREIIKMVHSNSLLCLYISKLIVNELEYGVTIESLSDIVYYNVDKKILNINITPLIYNDILVSQAHINELIQILNIINMSKDELIGKLYLLCKYLNYLTAEYFLSDNSGLTESEIIEHVIIPVKLLQFLIFVYSFKLSIKLNYNSLKPINIGDLITTLTNQSVHYINHKYGLNFENSIQFNNIEHDNNIGRSYTSNLNEAITQYEYLLSIDIESFIDAVFDDVKLQISDNTCKCHNISVSNIFKQLNINDPKIVDIRSILRYNENKTPQECTGLLDYVNLDEYKAQYNAHSIITIDYLHVLKLMNIPSIEYMTNVDKSINPILIRYLDIIVNDIYKDLIIDDFYTTPVSLLYILTHFIIPKMPNTDYTVETLQYILYRIIVPYLCDMFKVYKIIDYFH